MREGVFKLSIENRDKTRKLLPDKSREIGSGHCHCYETSGRTRAKLKYIKHLYHLKIFFVSIHTLSDDQLDAVGLGDVGDAGVVGRVRHLDVRDEELAGGHGDNLLRLEGDPGPVLGSEHAAVPGPVQAVRGPGHVRDADREINSILYTKLDLDN